ncbi:MAG: efflux family protein [Rhodospirillales bacterium]|nr:efflux family protein [Rhodospirillales bacterium]
MVDMTHDEAAVAPPAPILDRRTRLLLEGPIVATLLRMSAPNILVMVAQASTGLIETYFIGKLGIDALAGVALVFPGLMLMQMMSAGAMGGGISSGIARALGAGRRADADSYVLHALVISVILGIVFTLLFVGGGTWIYTMLGGDGASLRAALAYSDVVFGAAILVWVFNALGNVLRGTGNMLVPAWVTCGGIVFLVPLSPCLIFGIGPFPQLGVAGGAVAVVLYYIGGTAVLAYYLWSGRSVLTPRLHGVALRWAHFREILRVGAVAAISTLQTNLTVAATTGLVGSFGPGAIAGYGVGSRLEYLLVPLVFGMGGPLVALVGTNIGAHRPHRAMRVAWVGAAVCFALTEAIGLAAAAFPHAWLSLFGSDPAMLASGEAYFHAVGPFYGFFGGGMALYFASQGAARLLWPLIGGTLRLVIAVLGGWLALRWFADLGAVFLALGVAIGVYGIVTAVAIAGGAWYGRPNLTTFARAFARDGTVRG